METSNTKSRGFKLAIVLLLVFGILAAVAIAAIALNPDEETHHKAISTNVSKAVSESFYEQTNNLLGERFPSVQQLVEKASKPVIEDVTKTIIEKQLDYHDYVLFSTTTYTIPEFVSKLTQKNDETDSPEEDVRTISVGVFGKVFTADKQDVKKAINGFVSNYVEKTNFVKQFFETDSDAGSAIEQIFGDGDVGEKIEAGAKILNKILDSVLEEE